MEQRKQELFVRAASGFIGTLEQLHDIWAKTKTKTMQRTGFLDRRWAFWALLVVALGSLITVNTFDFALSVPRLKQLSGGLPILDMRFWYSETAAYSLLAALGASGRAAYLELLWTLDLAMPLLFGLFLSSAIRRTNLRRLSWLPFVASAFDYGENLAITILLLRYPVHCPAIAMAATIFTAMKWLFYVTSMLLPVAGLVHAWCTMQCRLRTRGSATGDFTLTNPRVPDGAQTCSRLLPCVGD